MQQNSGLFKMIVGVLKIAIHSTLEIGVYSCTEDQEILKVFSYDVRCAVVIRELKVHIRTAIGTITADMLQTNSIFVLMFLESQRVHI